MQTRIIGYGSIVALLLISYFTLGIFVIPPIGAVPEGATILYLRAGMDINFIESLDGRAKKDSNRLTLFARAGTLLMVSKVIIPRKIILLPYSESLREIGDD